MLNNIERLRVLCKKHINLYIFYAEFQVFPNGSQHSKNKTCQLREHKLQSQKYIATDNEDIQKKVCILSTKKNKEVTVQEVCFCQ